MLGYKVCIRCVAPHPAQLKQGACTGLASLVRNLYPLHNDRVVQAHSCNLREILANSRARGQCR